MKYNLTIWNILIGLYLPYVIFTLVRGGGDPGRYIGAAYALPVLIIGALIDLLAQQVIPNRRLLAILEIVSLVAIVIINKLP